MFGENDKVVYPGHGVAQISQIMRKQIAGKVCEFFELRFLNKDMIILVPIESALSIGVRKLSSPKRVSDVLTYLGRPATDARHEAITVNWNKRNKEYQGKIRSGDLNEIGEIYRSLRFIAHRKELSFGEKRLLQQTESLLAEEISVVNNVVMERATQQLRELIK